ncbi:MULTISPECIES: hypothetical protein [Bacillaceae]|uniref:Uncharacterized protein n=1 Tax=Evansella alkalicola TaxID=745819 RepID=A0ABS6JZW2_9BACI|nr:MULTISPECIES: hypothetical protein [Bacillaceae]MBU9724129.1 hypothetical protein [Bacillus alkalicola]
MKINVISAFTDSLSGKFYKKGDTFNYESENLERVTFLIEKKFLEKKKIVIHNKKEEVPSKPIHVGAGWYELPNGERVRGKESALEAFKGME